MYTPKRKIKFGILGCGLIANVHADAINHIPDAELVGVADNNYESALSFAQKQGIKAFIDYNDILYSPNDINKHPTEYWSGALCKFKERAF